MKTVKKNMYQCEHCQKWYHRRHACEIHEKGCSSNPENRRPCFDCIYLDKKNKTIYHHHPYLGEIEEDVKILHCSKLDKFIHPPKVEAKGNAFELGDEFNEPMPKSCEESKSVFENSFPLLKDYK